MEWLLIKYVLLSFKVLAGEVGGTETASAKGAADGTVDVCNLVSGLF